MTCIIGLVQKNKVYMVGDTLGVAGWDKTRRFDNKLFKKTVGNDQFLIGFTSSYRMGDLLRYTFAIPEIPQKTTDIREYMVNRFVTDLRGCYRDNGYLEKNAEVEKGGIFLIGVRGRLFKIESDFQVGESVNRFDACGCGQAYALGAMYVNKTMKTPKSRLLNAMDAVVEFSAGVGGKIDFEVI